MKKIICLLLAGAFLIPASACAQPIEPDLSAYDTAGPAEIPVEILGELDDATLADLVDKQRRLDARRTAPSGQRSNC